MAKPKRSGRPRTGQSKYPTSVTLTAEARAWLDAEQVRRGGMSVSAQIAELIAQAMRRAA
jgi:hypothetical protein